MARTGRGFRSWMTVSIALMAIGALLVFSGVAGADQPEDLQCPDGWVTKDASGADDNDLVPEAGLLICVKAGSPGSNVTDTGNTGIILTDGETSLQEYLYAAGIVDGSGMQGRDVSYWVTYETPTEEPSPTEEPDRSARLTVFKDADGDTTEEFMVGDVVLTGGTSWSLDLDNEDFLINDPEVVIVLLSEELTADQVAAGWELVDITCDEGATFETDLEEATLTVTLSDKEDVTCTFFNEQAAADESAAPAEETPTPTPTPTASPTPAPREGTLPSTNMPMTGVDLTMVGTLLLTAGATLSVVVAAGRRTR